MKVDAIVRFAWKGSLFLAVFLFSLTLVQVLILAYSKWWYQRQGENTERICQQIQPGMPRTAVWQQVHDNSHPHGESEVNHVLGFWTREGTCSVSLDPNTDRVVSKEYHRSPGQFIGIE